MSDQGLRHRFLTGSEANRSLAIATYFGLAAAVYPTVDGLISSLEDHLYLAATAWAVFLLAVVAWIVKDLIRHPYRALPPSDKFQPFVEPAQLNAWPRTEEIARLEAALADDTKLPVLVGPSGAGKTTILQVLLPVHGVQKHYFDSYADFFDTFPLLVEERERLGHAAPRQLVVLDQFEQLLANLALAKPAVRDQRGEDLALLVERWRSSDGLLVISVRYEWYFLLRVLGDSVPSPSHCVSISGPKPTESNDPTLRAIMRSLKVAVRGDEALALRLVSELGDRGSLLLLETQIVGSIVDSLLADGTPVTEKYLETELGGVAGAIDRYFDDVLGAAPNRRVALKVLAALSTATRFRRQVNREDILDVIFEEPRAVQEAIKYLVGRRLVVDRGGASQFELSHDFVAEYFHSRCGNELRPTDRDNVLFHLEAGPRHMGKAVLPRNKREATKGLFGWIVFGFLVATMLLRLLGLGIPWVQLGSLSPQYSTHNAFDATYVPIFIAHGAWTIYITLFYVRIFAMLDERPIARLFSKMVPLFMAACVVVAYFIPYAWMCSIGLGGLVLAGKLVSLSHNRDIGSGARARVGEFGRTTMAALIFLTVLGAAGMGISFALQSHAHFEDRWIAVSLFASLIMTLPCLVLAPYHVRKPAVSELLGLLARSPKGIVARTGI